MELEDQYDGGVALTGAAHPGVTVAPLASAEGQSASAETVQGRGAGLPLARIKRPPLRDVLEKLPETCRGVCLDVASTGKCSRNDCRYDHDPAKVREAKQVIGTLTLPDGA